MPRSKQPRRWLRRLLWAAAGIGLLAVLALAALWWRLQQGPIRIDFLEPRIESALSNLVAPVSVELGGTTLEWVGGGRPIEIQANDVRVLAPGPTELAGFASVGVGLYPPALLHGAVVPTRLVVRRTHAVVKRAEDGSFELGLNDTAASRDTAQPAQDFAELLDRWISPRDPDSPLSRLAEISIVDSRVEIHDRMMGIDWGADDVAATLKRTDGSLHADASWVLEAGENRSEMSASAKYEASSESMQVDARFKGLVPSAFANSYPGLEILAKLEDPLSGSATATLTEAVHLRSAELEVEGVCGSISASVSDVSDDFSSLSGTLDVKDLKPWLFADLLPQLAGLSRVRIVLGGHAALVFASNRVTSLNLDLNSGKGTITIPELYPNPVSVVSIALSAKAEDHFGKIEVGKIAAVLPDVTLGGTISATKRGDAYHANVKLGIDTATIAEVGKYWPSEAGGGAREWVVDHISAATVSDIELDLSVAATPGDKPDLELGAFETTFDFSGLSIDPLRPQPEVSGVQGSSTMTLDRLDFVVTGGGTQGIEIGASTVAITNLSGDDPLGLSLDLAISGPLESATAVIVSPPLEIVPPHLLAWLGGEATGEVKVEIPLEGDIAGDSVHTTAEVKLGNVVWKDSPVPVGNRELGDGVLDLRLDDDTLVVRGTIQLSGVPARVEYQENLGPGDPERRVVAHAVIDDAARKALDLPEVDYFSGSTSLDMIYIGRRDGSSRIEATADLTSTVLEIPQLGWTKAPGDPGHASGVFELSDDSWKLNPFEIDAGGLTANGSLELIPDPTELRHLEIERVQLGRSDFHATLSFDPATGHRLRVGGPAFDAVPLIDYLKKVDEQVAEKNRAGEVEEGGKRLPADIQVRLGELWIAERSRLGDLNADLTYDGQSMDKFFVQTVMDPVAHEHPQADPEVKKQAEQKQFSRLQLRHLPKDDGHELRFETDNLGLLVGGLHASTAIRGGTVALTATRSTPDAPYNGTVAITGFTLVDLPALAKVLEIGSLRGMSRGFTQEGLWFDKVTANLDWSDRKITISDGKALGHGFGITARGIVDLKTNVIDIDGAVTPMETIQRVIGHIPLLGRLLAGWNREGIIAVLYDIKGPMEDPHFKANGSSVLTPGITREIYRLAPDADQEDKPSKKKKKKKKGATAATPQPNMHRRAIIRFRDDRTTQRRAGELPRDRGAPQSLPR